MATLGFSAVDVFIPEEGRWGRWIWKATCVMGIWICREFSVLRPLTILPSIAFRTKDGPEGKAEESLRAKIERGNEERSGKK